MNSIDAAGLERLEETNHRLADGEITFHLSEVKGPVMDQFKSSHFLQRLSGHVHLSHFDAVASIMPELAQSTRAALCAGAGGPNPSVQST